MIPEFVLTDVDGTLLNPERRVSARARRAIDAYRAAGGRFTVASSRPPRGLSQVIEATGLNLPLAAFNGALILGPKLEVLESHPLATEDALAALADLQRFGLEAWIYRGLEWWVPAENGARVDRESEAVGFAPGVTWDLASKAEGALKIVGVSLDPALVARADAEMQARWQGRAQVSRSHACYLDITQARAHKGHALARLAQLAGSAPSRSLVLGDMPNDVPMFEAASFSVAMGNAADEVKRAAKATTASNGDEGFAKAVELYTLGAKPFHP